MKTAFSFGGINFEHVNELPKATSELLKGKWSDWERNLLIITVDDLLKDKYPHEKFYVSIESHDTNISPSINRMV